MENVIIIGGGIAGLTAAETIRKAQDRAEVTIITDEDYYPYSRIKLSKYINSEINFDDLYIHEKNWYNGKNISVHLSKRIREIDQPNRRIVAEDGDVLNYDKLIIASGSSNFIPPIPNINTKGVFSVRNIRDILNIQAYIKENGVKNVGVIGGGLLGIEAAWGLKSSGGFKVSIIETMPRLLPRQLDEEGSLILEGLIKDNGMAVYKGEGVREILGEDHVSKIVLNSGTVIDADLVIVSAGVRSNLELARALNISVNRGILVDEYMKTIRDGIFAAGDCAGKNCRIKCPGQG